MCELVHSGLSITKKDASLLDLMMYCKTLPVFFHGILMSQFSCLENLLHFSLVDFQVAYQITAVTLMVMGNSKRSHVFNFAILLKS